MFLVDQKDFSLDTIISSSTLPPTGKVNRVAFGETSTAAVVQYSMPYSTGRGEMIITGRSFVQKGCSIRVEGISSICVSESESTTLVRKNRSSILLSCEENWFEIWDRQAIPFIGHSCS